MRVILPLRDDASHWESVAVGELRDVDISEYEGLVFKTAARYAPLLDDDPEDVQQLLRLKIAQARMRFDPSRTRLDERSYVFSCVTNRVKDMLKAQSRRNDARGGGPLYVQDAAGEAVDRFERRYLSMSPEEAFMAVEEEEIPELPSTLTPLEKQVVTLLLLDLNQTEMARVLCVGRWRIADAHTSVKAKMQDWAPDGWQPALQAAA